MIVLAVGVLLFCNRKLSHLCHCQTDAVLIFSDAEQMEEARPWGSVAVGLLTRRVAEEAEDYLLKACFMLTYRRVCAGGDGGGSCCFSFSSFLFI